LAGFCRGPVLASLAQPGAGGGGVVVVVGTVVVGATVVVVGATVVVVGGDVEVVGQGHTVTGTTVVAVGAASTLYVYSTHVAPMLVRPEPVSGSHPMRASSDVSRTRSNRDLGMGVLSKSPPR
jgi:hypothetical protein